MRCSEISILLATRRDLSTAQEQAVRAHLDDCGSCATLWNREERTSRVLRALPLPPVKQPPMWVQEEVQAMLQHKLSSRWRWRYGLALAGAAIVTLVFLLLPYLSTKAVPRFSPLDGTYQPGPLGVPLPAPELTPTADGQAPWHFYLVSRSRHLPGDLDWHTKVLDPKSGAEQLILDDVDDILLSPDGTRLYATVPGYVLALDPQTRQKLWQVELDHDLGWAGEAPWLPPSKLAISHDGRLLYVYIGDEIGNLSYVIRAIDTQTAQLLPQKMITPAKYVDGNCPQLEMLTPSVGDWIYVVCSTGVFRGTITVEKLEPVMVRNDFLADAILSHDRSKLYVLSYKRKIYIIDAATNTVERTVELDVEGEELPYPGRGHLALSGDGSKLAIANVSGYSAGGILIIDTYTWQTVKHLPLDLPIADYSLYMNANGSRIYFVTIDPTIETEFNKPFDTLAEIDSDSGQTIRIQTFRNRHLEKLLRGP